MTTMKRSDSKSEPYHQRKLTIPVVETGKFIQRTNGVVKGYAVNTFNGMAKSYNQDRVSIIMNITKPNHKGRWPHCSYFGVFDGHGGSKCSDFLKENMHRYITENAYFPNEPIEALKFGFRKAEQQFVAYAEQQQPIQRAGSCALVLLIIDNTCYVANVGDSRAILSTKMGAQVYSISKDHKPEADSERERILAAGGKIYQSVVKTKSGHTILGPHRIDPGKLSVSRSIGDIEAKLPRFQGNQKVLIAKPDITYFEVNPEQHDFVIMGSDGIYDRMNNQEIVECFWVAQRTYLKSRERQSRQSQTDLNHKNYNDNREPDYSFVGNVSSRIIQRSMEKMSMDNLTALVVLFEDRGRIVSSQAFSTQKVQDDCGKQNTNNLNQSKYKECQNESQGKYKPEYQDKLKVKANDKYKFPSSEMIYPNRSHNQLEELLLKRKSSTTVDTGIGAQINSHSTASTKHLAYTKSHIRQPKQQPLNQLLQKKRSCDILRRQKKDLLWKQLTGVSTEKLQRMRS